MKKACIISTGSELMIGKTLDSNAAFLATQLTEIGIKVVAINVVGDELEAIKRAWEKGMEIADIVISTGGLGPTADDLTRESLSEVLHKPLYLNQDELNRIKTYFSQSQRVMPESNTKQALFPEEVDILDNKRGTAAGFSLINDNKLLILLPGPPIEMEVMFKQEVKPRLLTWRGESQEAFYSRTLKVMGLGESQVEDLILPVMSNLSGCLLGLLAADGEVHIKLSRVSTDSDEATRALDLVSDHLKQCLGANVYGGEEDSLAGVVLDLLERNGENLALAESCTGGLIGKMLTDIPGSSRSFWGGVISYSNEAKTRVLEVRSETLKEYGAVSHETAGEMARGIRSLSGCHYGLSITGIAGPDGGSTEKPVGLVYVGLAMAEGEQTKKLQLIGERDRVRTLAAKHALDWLRRYLENKS
ncbi:MAG: competence/damage-inducible protein A [Syntrophomonadaceae bacterium]|nr:competence/damage-inducible protein A [Syntrophomonadaceae bacterium]